MSKIKYSIQRIDGCNSIDKYSQQRLDKYWAKASDGRYQCSVEKAKRDKTAAQCRLIFGQLINRTIDFADDYGIDASGFVELLNQDLPDGVPLSKELVKDYLYKICPTFNDKGQKITLSKMTVRQASDWYERCRNKLAAKGILIEKLSEGARNVSPD